MPGIEALDGQEVFGLVFLLAVLGFWIAALRSQMSFRRDEKRRQREAKERAAQAEENRRHGGPWGGG